MHINRRKIFGILCKIRIVNVWEEKPNYSTFHSFLNRFYDREKTFSEVQQVQNFHNRAFTVFIKVRTDKHQQYNSQFFLRPIINALKIRKFNFNDYDGAMMFHVNSISKKKIWCIFAFNFIIFFTQEISFMVSFFCHIFLNTSLSELIWISLNRHER